MSDSRSVIGKGRHGGGHPADPLVRRSEADVGYPVSPHRRVWPSRYGTTARGAPEGSALRAPLRRVGVRSVRCHQSRGRLPLWPRGQPSATSAWVGRRHTRGASRTAPTTAATRTGRTRRPSGSPVARSMLLVSAPGPPCISVCGVGPRVPSFANPELSAVELDGNSASRRVLRGPAVVCGAHVVEMTPVAKAAPRARGTSGLLPAFS